MERRTEREGQEEEEEILVFVHYTLEKFFPWGEDRPLRMLCGLRRKERENDGEGKRAQERFVHGLEEGPETREEERKEFGDSGGVSARAE